MTRLKVRIVGAGLIGTSIGLKLKELGYAVEMIDVDIDKQKLASDLVSAHPVEGSAELVIAATPARATFSVLKREFQLNPKAIFIDVCSVKTKLQLEVDSFPELSERFVSTHPIAGREVGGAESAQADLFEGRAWVLTSGSPELRLQVAKLIRELGATPYEMSSTEHDSLFSRISHLPQLLSTVLANTTGTLGDELSLAGQGLRDMLRLAASDGQLWSGILLENREQLLEAISLFKNELAKLESSLASEDADLIIELFNSARQNRERVTGKHGARARNYTFVDVVIEDKPGQLAAIFNQCGEIGVNVEDLTLEHSPRQETGLVRLALSKPDADKLNAHLQSQGWKSHIL